MGPDICKQLGSRKLRISLFLAACALNIYALYAPRIPGPDGVPGVDKVAHIAIFALVMVTGMAAGIGLRTLLVALLLQTLASEVSQHLFVSGRTGDVWDAAADLAGIGLGWAAGNWLLGNYRPARVRLDAAGPTGSDHDR
ncbi:MAG: hypothetical protein ACK5H2_03100 [Beutenbergiaceae bacterium]